MLINLLQENKKVEISNFTPFGLCTDCERGEKPENEEAGCSMEHSLLMTCRNVVHFNAERQTATLHARTYIGEMRCPLNYSLGTRNKIGGDISRVIQCASITHILYALSPECSQSPMWNVIPGHADVILHFVSLTASLTSGL